MKKEETFAIRKLTDADRVWLEPRVRAGWGGSTVIASRGPCHDVCRLSGLVAVNGGEPWGVLCYAVGPAWEVVLLEAYRQRSGIGIALMCEIAERARAAGAARIWRVTTNDNLEAQRFYQAIGMRYVATHKGAVDEARTRLKPDIPLVGANGIEIHDEVEYEQRF